MSLYADISHSGIDQHWRLVHSGWPASFVSAEECLPRFSCVACLKSRRRYVANIVLKLAKRKRRKLAPPLVNDLSTDEIEQLFFLWHLRHGVCPCVLARIRPPFCPHPQPTHPRSLRPWLPWSWTCGRLCSFQLSLGVSASLVQSPATR